MTTKWFLFLALIILGMVCVIKGEYSWVVLVRESVLMYSKNGAGL